MKNYIGKKLNKKYVIYNYFFCIFVKKYKMIGIYKITNPNGKIYIGQSRDLKNRELQYSKYLKRHCRQLKIVNSIKSFVFF